MGQFYKELTKPDVAKAEALHQAQLAVFKQYKAPYYGHLMFWLELALVGSLSPLISKRD
jgi:CHAT domain-containing protein